jgi:hypothetical protein
VNEPGEPYRSPYTRTPGSPTPPPEVTPEEGRHELWAFFWVQIVSAVIIAVGGLSAYFYLHH